MGTLGVDDGWVAAWASAQAPADSSGPSAEGLAGLTVRNLVHVGIGGDRLRVRLSNAFGTRALTIGAASLGIRAPGSRTAIVEGTRRTLRFAGRTEAVLPPGSDALSDPVELELAAGQDVAVSLYLPEPTGPVTWHPEALATNYLSTPGDRTAQDGPEAYDREITSWLFLSALYVQGSGAVGTVVTLGPSTTDGVGSTPDTNRRYPDLLAHRLRSHPTRLGVANAGISGNRLLTDAGPAGVSALARLDRDVLSHPGVRAVVVWEGMNDIGNAAGPRVDRALTLDDLISGWSQLVERCHAHGIAVVGATLQPYAGAEYATVQGRALRQAANDWIRTAGVFDAVADFDAALEDPARPGWMLPSLDSGDHLHPSDAGYRAIAGCVELEALLEAYA